MCTYEVIEEVDEFCYLGKIITHDGVSNSDITKERQTSECLTSYGDRYITRINLFNTKVKSVLLCGCETCMTTKINTDKLLVR